MPANHVLLETIELSQNASSVTFDNIPQSGYKHLKIVASARSTGAESAGGAISVVTFNGSSANLSTRILGGNGSTTSSSTDTSVTMRINPGDVTSDVFGNSEMFIANYTSTNPKSFFIEHIWEQAATLARQELTAGLYNSSSSISSITITAGLGSFVAYSTFSLYGVAEKDITPVTAPFATGGNIVANDGTYWYHAFLSSGTFTPAKALTCDYLVIAGGGAGGSSPNGQHGGGGGGAGGYLSSVGSSGGGATAGAVLSLTAQSYAVSVGAGGTSNANGTNTTFAGLTATGGGKGGISGTGAGSTGGSGGGGSSSSSPGAGGSATASPVQGYAGGNGQGTNNYACGGGGGAGAAGRNGGISPDSINSDGGDGKNTLSTWASVTNTGVGGYYAGGGGGGFGQFGAFNGSGGGGGGLGGGGNGVTFTNGAVATSGTANTGGGGGGSSESGRFTNSAVGGNGGSGIVIVRYPMV